MFKTLLCQHHVSNWDIVVHQDWTCLCIMERLAQNIPSPNSSRGKKTCFGICCDISLGESWDFIVLFSELLNFLRSQRPEEELCSPADSTATSQRQKSQVAFYDQRPLNTLGITWSKWAKGCNHKHENFDLLQLNDMSDGCVPQNYFAAPINSSLTKPEIHNTKKKRKMLPHPQETCLSHENFYFKFRSVFRTTTWKILASMWSGFTQEVSFLPAKVVF